MLLPAKFQTHLPYSLGEKVVAIAPAPKPHVHQWVSVPDSKIHSRCAECGTVTLTEIVAPKVMAYAPTAGGQAMLDLVADINGRIAQAMGMIPQWVGVDPAAPGSDRTVFSEHFLGKPYSFVDLLRTPEQAPPTNKTGAEFRMKIQALDAELRAGEAAMKARASERRLAAWADIGEAFCKPAKHYTSITAPDGRVRMVETDAEGWIKNDGTQPVAGQQRVQVRANGCERPADKAFNYLWQNDHIVTHWRPAA